MSRSRVFALVVRFSIIAVVSLLIIEFLLGMWVNLYAAFPIGTKLSLSLQPDFSGKVELQVHLILGVLLGVISLIVLIFSALLKKVGALALGLVGVISIAAAGFSGLALASGGYTNTGESYVMAVAFLVAILIYVNIGRLVPIPSEQTGKVFTSNPKQPSTN
jgi:hypothetical protein